MIPLKMGIRGTDQYGCALKSYFQHSVHSWAGRLLPLVSSCTYQIFNQLHTDQRENTECCVLMILHIPPSAKAALAQSDISRAWFCFSQKHPFFIKISESFERAQNSGLSLPCTFT